MTLQALTMPSPIPAGLQSAITSAGHTLMLLDNTWVTDNPTAVAAIIASYNPLAAVQAQAVASVQAQYLSLIKAGFTYQNVLVSIDPISQANINSMASQAIVTLQATSLGVSVQPWPANFVWLPQGAGNNLPLTASQMITFASAVAHYVSALILYLDSLIAQIQAATTTDAVAAILSGAVWPTS